MLEYLAHIESNERVPKASNDDERLVLFEEEDWDEAPDDEGLPEPVRMEIEPFLRGKSKAEGLIARVSPSAYDEAVRYLRKAGAVMAREGKQQEWAQYVQDLRTTHARKSRFIQALGRLSAKPIVTKKR